MGYPKQRMILRSSFLLIFICHHVSMVESHSSGTGHQPDLFAEPVGMGAQDDLASNGIVLAEGGRESPKPGETPTEAQRPEWGMELQGEEIKKKEGAGPETKNLRKISWISGIKTDKLDCKKIVKILTTIWIDYHGKLVIFWVEICDDDGGKNGSSGGDLEEIQGILRNFGTFGGNSEGTGGDLGQWFKKHLGQIEKDNGGNHVYPEWIKGRLGGSQGNLDDNGGNLARKMDKKELCSAPQSKYTVNLEDMINSLPIVLGRIIWETALNYGDKCVKLFYQFANLDEAVPLNTDDKFGRDANTLLDNRIVWPVIMLV